MTLKITWLGHSAFEMVLDGHSIVTDPFLTGNPLAAAHPEQLRPEIILLSHAHGDHVGDAVNIAKQSQAKIVSNFEIVSWCERQGVSNTHPQNSGGSFNHGFMTAKWTVAFHSSSFPDGTYGGDPNGFVLTGQDSGLKIYYAGDTALFSDMKLIGDYGLDVAFLPIGDNFTMGIDDSIIAIQHLRPRYVVPMHYNTFPLIMQDASKWAHKVIAETGAVPIVLDPGGSYTLSG